MFRITATRIEGEDRVEVDIVEDGATSYEIGAVAMTVDEIIDKMFKDEFGIERILQETGLDKKESNNEPTSN